MGTRYRSPSFISEPGEVYRSRRNHFLSSHQLADFRWCPAYYRRKIAGLVPEVSSEAYGIGAAAHCLILEGRKVFESQYVVGGPINPATDKPYGRDTKKYREWEAEQGKSALSDDQYGLVCQLEYAVKQHERAKELLSQGLAEGVLRLPDVPCQIRVDWWNPDEGVIDLKTCGNIDDFEADARKYRYIHQMAFYCFAIYQVTREIVPATLIAVEKQEPFRVAIYQIDGEDLAVAGRENEAAMQELKSCRLNSDWPTRYELPRTLRL